VKWSNRARQYKPDDLKILDGINEQKDSPFCAQKDRLVKTSVGKLEGPADESEAEGVELTGSASNK
jgi:hypothetical protein